MDVTLKALSSAIINSREQEFLRAEPVVTALETDLRRTQHALIGLTKTNETRPILLADSIIPRVAVALHSASTGLRDKVESGTAISPRLSRDTDERVYAPDPVSNISMTASPTMIDAVPVRIEPPADRALPRVRAGSRQVAARLRSATDKSKAVWLLLAVSVNGTPLSDVVRAEQRPDGTLLLPLEAWTEARLVAPAQAASLSDGTPGYALGSVEGLTYTVNDRTLSLDINAPSFAFAGSILGTQDGVTTSALRPEPGVMVNYDTAVTRADRNLTSGALLEATAFSSFGNLVTSAVVRNGDSGAQSGITASRLDTYWQYDLPDRMETLVVGDTVGVGGGWSRPVRYGGVRWGRDFSTRPGFVTLPQIALAGQAALPSTVEVLLNNSRRLSQQTQPGPFSLPNVPVVTGAGEISLIVRDLLGRETVVNQSYYASPRLLAPGLNDFSFEAGWMRTGYGRETAYADPFGASTWRQGLTNGLTGEMRLELQRDRRATGTQLTTLLGHWAVGSVSAAVSSSSLQGLQESGVKWQSSVERSTLAGGGALQYEHASSGFVPFGESSASAAMSGRARGSWLATLGAPLWGQVNGSVNYVSQTRWAGERMQLAGASISLPVWWSASLNMSFTKRLDGDKGWRVAASLSLPLDGHVRAALRFDRDSSGHQNIAVTAAQNAPAGPGWGWRMGTDADTSGNGRARGSLQYNTSQAEGTLESEIDAQGRVAARASARGTVGWLDGKAFASRPVGDGSVAVVKLEGIEGIPVRRSHQVVAVTDARGLAFVPGLLPWQKNLIEIDPVDLPLDVEVASPTHEVIPYPRSGLVIDFLARRSRQALLVLHQGNGTPVPVGTRVRLLPNGPEFSVGRRGEVWLADLSEKQQHVRATWPSGGCLLELKVPATDSDTVSKIGPLACDEGHQ